jgi:hypothetical protein
VESGHFDEQTKKLIAAILSDGDVTRTRLDEHASDLGQNVREIHELASRNHQETIKAIRDLCPKEPVIPENIDSHQTLLKTLRFHGMDHRYEDIEKAHKRTFEWIFSGAQRHENSSCPFSEWMKGDNGVYWVPGKAGSGKSTLMKYLVNDDRTHAAFKQRACERRMVMADYWFWDLGTNSLQKSLEGLSGLCYKTSPPFKNQHLQIKPRRQTCFRRVSQQNPYKISLPMVEPK